MDRKAKALDFYGRRFHCSQAVLAAYSDLCGITEEQALKLGACFGSGMRKGEVCGACTGALMVLGLMLGHDGKDPADKLRSDRINDLMMQKFASRCGSYVCNVILGCDISTKEGVAFAVENRLFTELCPKMVAAAVDSLEEILAEYGVKTD